MEPQISVVLPVFNGARFLRLAIESVLQQSFSEFELIIWDDASIDTSREIIDSYPDPRIRIFTSEVNKGLFKTLNLAIDKAEGKWIRLWSQDDIMKENCLASEAEFLGRYPDVGMGICSYDCIDEAGNITLKPEPVHPLPIVSRETVDQILFYKGCLPGTISTVILKASALKEVGNFAEHMRVAGDFEMWARLADKYAFSYNKERLVSVRFHRSQLSGQPGSYVLCMREVKAVYEELLGRLPAEISNYAKWFDCLTRGATYTHHFFRCLLACDFANARGALREIRQLDHHLLAGLYWLFSANQNLFKLKPRYRVESGDFTSDHNRVVV